MIPIDKNNTVINTNNKNRINIRGIIGLLRNPRIVKGIKVMVTIVLFIIALVNKDIDFLLQGVTQMLLP